MSAPNVSVFMLERLREWGVRRVYGYPGDGSNGLNLAFHEVGEEIEFIQLRHEELAAFAACAHAKLTGEVGVCMATSGPGAIHLLNGLYDAKLDHAPVVAHRRPAEADVAGRRLPAGGRPARALQGRRRRVPGRDHRSPPGGARGRPRGAHRTCATHRDRDHRPLRRPGAGLRGAPARARRPLRRHAGLSRSGRAARRRGSAPRRRRAQRGREGRDPRRPGRQARRRRAASRSPSCWARAWPRRSTGAPCCPTTCPSSPARSACSGPSRPPT